MESGTRSRVVRGRAVRAALVVVGWAAVAACQPSRVGCPTTRGVPPRCPPPCGGPPSAPGARGAPPIATPARTGAAPVAAPEPGGPTPPGAKFVRIRIVNQTTNFAVKRDETVYRYHHAEDDMAPDCSRPTVASGDRPFPKVVPPMTTVPYDLPAPPHHACEAGGYSFQIELHVVHRTASSVTREITVDCDAEGFEVAEIVLSSDPGQDPNDPDGLTASCSCD